MWRLSVGCALLLAATAATPATAAAAGAPVAQSLEDAWWTGPMLAPSPATLPTGHALIEPYLFNVISNGHIDAAGNRHTGPHEHDIGSLTYALYGLTDHITVGVIPRFGYNEPAGEPNSSGIGFGDLTLQVGYGLTQFSYDHRVPTVALVVQQTLPTGRYDRLARPADGFGAGAYTTTLAVYSQDYFWMPNGRILRTRLDVSYAISASTSVNDVSVYGTPQGFVGRAWPGDSLSVDLAGEYSVTSHWVLALDVIYARSDSTRVSGSAPAMSTFEVASGPSYSVGFAPAIEYNWNARVGLLLGVRFIQIGRNTTTSVTPAIALNMVF